MVCYQMFEHHKVINCKEPYKELYTYVICKLIRVPSKIPIEINRKYDTSNL
jgi:hypothetical protein